jgi:hypothetical protein
MGDPAETDGTRPSGQNVIHSKETFDNVNALMKWLTSKSEDSRSQ